MFFQVLEVHILFLRIFIRKKEASGSFKPKATSFYKCKKLTPLYQYQEREGAKERFQVDNYYGFNNHVLIQLIFMLLRAFHYSLEYSQETFIFVYIRVETSRKNLNCET